MYDAPFSLKKADSFTLHLNGQPQLHPRPGRAAAVRRHQASTSTPELPNHGVKLPAAGVKIKVLEQNGTSMKIRFS